MYIIVRSFILEHYAKMILLFTICVLCERKDIINGTSTVVRTALSGVFQAWSDLYPAPHMADLVQIPL